MTAPTLPGTATHESYAIDEVTSDGEDLVAVASRIREHVLAMCASTDGGHVGGSLSLVDILTSLYFRVLRVDPQMPALPERDVLLLSKGHGGIGLYATLAEAGFFDVAELGDYGRPGGHLMAHPHPEVAGVEMASGSLGHGLAVGLGFALAMRLDSEARRTFVIMGDGELQEGSVWEAASVASHQGLDNLIAIVDRNRLQISGDTETVDSLEPLAQRWAAFGWTVRECDGHDIEALSAALAAAPVAGKPTVLIAHTTKGKGVPFLEGQARSHFVKLSERQYRRALSGLRATTGGRS